MSPTLGYWDIRGLAQPIRLLLAYTETPYTDKRYKYGPKPDIDQSEWLNEKYSLGLPFPNLPYYIDGDIKITQSLAIIRYLGRKHDLMGNTEEEENRISLVEQQLKDNNNGFTKICYNQNFDTLKLDYLKQLPLLLDQLSKFLGERPYFAGEHLTYVDFLVYEYLDQQKLFSPQIVSQYNNLVQYLARFESLPKIDKYLKSDRYLKWPLNGDSAYYGSRYEQPE
ncbi:glutathione S-transferase 2-like [Oppia nitens]|uniref:glutathione S-transferase 2-like n=1 Tax=Oppia nitens TaxID=1686743 RepID=UPI0023DCD9D7|nr:glutathione S-transferase 2-like [Oppia nitens]